ncbi:MAG TPA: GIY-YIG nuclease family protein [Allosphingosinicella sp.]|jgi:putative endonuclease
MRGGWVYMMADRYRGTIYTGVTSDIGRRSFQHREGRGSRFVQKYGLLRLVYVEPYERIDEAIAGEKAIKKWLRAWKIELIEKANPGWLDLFEHTANP